EPAPAAAAQEFLTAFRRWRAAAGMDNAIADRLAELFGRAGLNGVVGTPQHETVQRSGADFAEGAGIWADVAAARARQRGGDGSADERARARAETELRAWADGGGESMTMYLLAVDGAR